MFRDPISIRNILLLTIGTLSLLVAIFPLLQVVQEWRRMEKVQALRSATLVGDRLFEAAERLSVERDITFFMLHTRDQDLAAGMSENMKENRESVESILPTALHDIKKYNFL